MDAFIDFDPGYYQKSNADLKGLSQTKLRAHFLQYGIREGRAGSEAYFREDFLAMMDTSKPCLEIGPFCNPAVKGPAVKYFDVNDKEGLIRRANEHGIDPQHIPNIDFVDPNGNLDIVPDSHFDAAFSAHTIEHQYNLVAHLDSVSRLLTEGGRYFVVSPDQRYCFDHFQVPTTVAEVIADYQNKPPRHSIRSVLNYFMNVTHNDPVRHWSGDHGTPGSNTDKLANLRLGIEHFRKHGDSYIDVHGYYFTPLTFTEIIDSLFAMGLIDLRIEKLFPTTRNQFEFFVILKKESAKKNGQAS